MAISAWKQVKGTNSKWALRVNPSSGNLHPTETHLLCSGVDGIDDGAYHYSVIDHSLEKRTSDDLIPALQHLIIKSNIEPPPIMLCLSSIFWREAWKYRNRAFRYCQLDLGHAAASIAMSCASLGWSAKQILEFPDHELSKLIGLAESDEKPMILIALYPGIKIDSSHPLISNSSINENANFRGLANTLSSSQVEYSAIDKVYKATCLDEAIYLTANRSSQSKSSSIFAGNRNFEFPEDSVAVNLLESYFVPALNESINKIQRKRRSAVSMDGIYRTSLAKMSCILVESSRGFDSCYSKQLTWNSDQNNHGYFIHIILYVHRVDGIAPGVYYFDRSALTLNTLNENNVRSHAKFVSCLQDIASEGVFAVSLIADFEKAYTRFGERAYRYIHQEAGFIGQLFYLTSKALEIDATGIGCFLDDEINQSLPSGMETVYNFTFGRAVNDPRLSDLPAYS